MPKAFPVFGIFEFGMTSKKLLSYLAITVKTLKIGKL